MVTLKGFFLTVTKMHYPLRYFKILVYLHFAVYLSVKTLRIDFVINGPIHFISDYSNI